MPVLVRAEGGLGSGAQCLLPWRFFSRGCVRDHRAASVVLARESTVIGERLGFRRRCSDVTALGADAPEIASAVGRSSPDTRTPVSASSWARTSSTCRSARVSALMHGPCASIAKPVAHGACVVVAIIGAPRRHRRLSGSAGLILAMVVLAPYVVVSALHERARSRLPAALREAVAEEQRVTPRRVQPSGETQDALAVVPALAAVVGGAYGMVAAARRLAIGSRLGPGSGSTGLQR